MLEVENYIANIKNPNQKCIIQFWHNILATYPTIISKIAFKVPFYYQNTWVCYLNPVKANGIELVFINGQQLKLNSLLQTKGRKMVAGISFYSMEELGEGMVGSVLEIFEEALKLDERKRNKRT
jgi:hypothetical protein